MGSLYLLHFSERLCDGPQHYLGWTSRDVIDRVNEHLCGRGASLLRAVVGAGIHVEHVRTWEDTTPLDERRIKSSNALRRFCPVCLPLYQAEARWRMRRLRARRRGLDCRCGWVNGKWGCALHFPAPWDLEHLRRAA